MVESSRRTRQKTEPGMQREGREGTLESRSSPGRRGSGPWRRRYRPWRRGRRGGGGGVAWHGCWRRRQCRAHDGHGRDSGEKEEGVRWRWPALVGGGGKTAGDAAGRRRTPAGAATTAWKSTWLCVRSIMMGRMYLQEARPKCRVGSPSYL
ncbi:hypothetical protein BS78_10G171200 [Paspalum vaginatum]|nr:hypothetical protein BS78_10G171200 [Paspalum vaginatum]